MIDTVQAVLLFVIVLLTILFLVLGVQVFLILKDLRETLRRANNILDQAESLTSSINTQLNNVSNVVSSASVLGIAGKVFSLFVNRKK